MRQGIAVLIGTLLATTIGATGTIAKKKTETAPPIATEASPYLRSVDYDPIGGAFPASRSAASAADTLVLGYWTFESGSLCSAQDWTSVDLTAQVGEYWHVDDFAGLGGGRYGRLVALEGSRSIWCGARPSTGDPLCHYASLPGYGNNWNQAFCTKNCLSVTGDVTFDYLAAWDSEPGYDGTVIEWDLCDDNWTPFPATGSGGGCYYCGGSGRFHFDGVQTDTLLTIVFPDSLHNGNVRVRGRFISDGGWSDEDGSWDSDGAVIFDSLLVRDSTGIVLALEDFEDDPVGATATADWATCNDPGYGTFAGLFTGFEVLQEDPCYTNTSCVWAWISGSTYNYSCGGYPGQVAVPKGNSRGQYLDNEIWSPEIPWVGTGNVALLEFDVYRDNPFDNLVFWIWRIRSIVGGCPGPWKYRTLFYGDQKDWFRQRESVGDLIDGAASHVQVATGAVDLCSVWCGSVGTGNCHSHAPLIDNIALYRVSNVGPQWSVRDLDLFQDTFPGDGTITGTGRIDQASDILQSYNPNIRPGDSAVVQVSDPENSLSGDPYTLFGKAVYCYVSVWPQNQPGKSGTALTDDSFRWPVVDSLTYNGNRWYCIRMDSVFVQPNRKSPIADRYCVDLNDNLFAACDTICFVFCAKSVGGAVSYWSGNTGTVASLNAALDNPEEMQILPGKGWKNGGEILYVDAADGSGVQPYFDSAFHLLGILGKVDRYDVRAPSSGADNRPDSRVKNRLVQLIGCYRKIIWNTGSFANTLGDGGSGGGGSSADKTDDYAMLVDFLNLHPDNPGVYLGGDDLAERWATASGSAAFNLKNWCQHTLASGNAKTSGYGTSPLGVGRAGGCFAHGLDLDTLVVYGGCPVHNDFDVVLPSGNATTEMFYRGNSLSGSAVIGQVTPNAASSNARMLVAGFSYHFIRDATAAGTPARVHHLSDILAWFDAATPTGIQPVTARNALLQNYPNPFNPVTTIAFTVKEPAHVSLRIYNVSGQLVRTLVNDSRAPGLTHKIEWNGRSDAGASVASGVYFYKLVTKDFTQTRKMVLLK